MVRKIFKISLLSILITNFINYGAVLLAQGTSGAIILNQPIGARAIGMGEAYTSIHGDILGIYYNPAGVAILRNKQLSFVYGKGIIDDSFRIVTFGFPIQRGAIVGSITYYTVGDIELINTAGKIRSVKAQEDYMISLSYSAPFATRNIFVGLNVKGINSTLVEEFNKTALVADIGGLYKTMGENLSFGLSFQNLETQIIDINKSDPILMTIRTGMSYKINLPQESILLLAFDLIKFNYNIKTKINLGCEYWHRKLLAIRTGYKIGYDLDSLSMGFGLNYEKVNIDYSIGLMGELNTIHHISLNLQF